MNITSVLRPLVSTPRKRSVLLGLTAAYMLVQISSLPIALSLPSLADYFDTGLDDAAWIVIAYLVMVGSLVLLAARLGDRFGHINVFFAGMVVAFVASAPMALSQELWQLVVWRGLTGVGAALIMGNANAVLAATFSPDQRGRAFSIPIIGARFGTLIGLALFAVFLHFFSWRLVFAAYVPIGLVAMIVTLPMLKYRERGLTRESRGGVDWPGGLLLASAAIALVLSGTHVHGGEESFTSDEGLQYHLPMHGLFLVLLALFVFVETRVSNPVVAMNHFRQKYFSMSLASNVTYHFSMVATMTLVPIVVEEGFGMSPLYVPIVLLPSQALGLFVPVIAGWIYDRYQPRMLRPITMTLIAGGFLVLGLSTPHVSFWMLPLLMLPISIGTNMFNPINNATVMNSLPLEHRGVASGMLETTREMGHALGATAAASALALVLPAGIELLSGEAAEPFYIQGFRGASLMVVFTLMAGASFAYFHKGSLLPRMSSPSRQPNSEA